MAPPRAVAKGRRENVGTDWSLANPEELGHRFSFLPLFLLSPLLPSNFPASFLLSLPFIFLSLLSAFLPLSLLFLLEENWKQLVSYVYSNIPWQLQLTAQDTQAGAHPLLILSLDSFTRRR